MRSFHTVLMFIVTLAVFGGVAYYLAIRFALFFPFLSKRLWVTIFAAIALFLIICIMFLSTTANPAGRTLYMISAVTAGVLVLLLMTTAVSDLLYLIFKFSPAVRCGIALGGALLLTVYSVINAYTIRVKEVTIPVDGLSKEIVAVHLTDIHLGDFRGKGQVHRIVQKINELKPDVIFNTGDMFDGKVHFKKGDVLDEMKTVDIPQFFVYGNHDQYVGVDKVIKLMQGANVTVLQNEVANFGELQIIGLNNMPVDKNTHDPHAPAHSKTIEEVMAELQLNDSVPTIALHHRPEGVQYIQAKGADVMLSGHTHGGQFFPITLFAKAIYDYNKGLYKFKDMSIYVSEGIGTIFTPLRLASNSELALIHFVPVSR